MDEHSLPFMDSPAVYRIEVTGCPSEAWLASIWGSEIIVDECQENGGHRVFIIGMSDQAALVGCINSLYNLGHGILSIEIVDTKLIGRDNEGTST